MKTDPHLHLFPAVIQTDQQLGHRHTAAERDQALLFIRLTQQTLFPAAQHQPIEVAADQNKQSSSSEPDADEISQPHPATSTSRRSPTSRSSSIVMLSGTDDLVDLADDDFTGTGGTSGSRDNALSMEANSIALTMTPTTRFPDQPVLLDVKKVKFPSGVGAAPSEAEDDHIINLSYISPNILLTSLAAALGFVIGAVCYKWPIDDSLEAWIGLFGRLYQNVMECLALPLIFTSVAICIGQLVIFHKTKSVIIRLLVFFFGSCFLSALLATLLVLGFTSMFTVRVAPLAEGHASVPTASISGSTELLIHGMVFTATNITGITLKTAPAKTISYAFQISNFFQALFPANITDAFATQQLLGIIIFSSLLGAGVVLSHESTNNTGVNHAFVLLKQISVVLELVLNWMLTWTPMETLSAMAYSIMKATITQQQLQVAIYLPITLRITFLAVFFVIGCRGYFIFVRKNPFQFLWYLAPAQVFLFATGSYPASIPVLMRSVEGSRQVSRTLANFSLSIGVSLSLCGRASISVICCYFMAYTSGQSDLLTGGRVP
ncbi:TPA: hypothetical protein N0F65_012183 [Lagenidium giganteum]|uniref:Amino acid transporter n=1 Tax=Lagenidium giganteum TaxID=4803 RepID=A0AAV2ZFH7_9STRA|nr:TPA: hypothetical protein N0F65_012183 [Lagenidium giganteum]